MGERCLNFLSVAIKTIQEIMNATFLQFQCVVDMLKIGQAMITRMAKFLFTPKVSEKENETSNMANDYALGIRHASRRGCYRIRGPFVGNCTSEPRLETYCNLLAVMIGPLCGFSMFFAGCLYMRLFWQELGFCNDFSRASVHCWKHWEFQGFSL